MILVPPDVPPDASLGVSTSEANRDAARPEEEWLDAEQAIGQHLAVLADASASEDARDGSQDALLTTLRGGYDPEVRLLIARWLLEAVDVAYHSLLARHLEAIRDEARVVGKEQVAKEVSGLLKRLPTAEAVREASLSVLRRRRAAGLGTHSFFWASFVAAGDWRWGFRVRDMAESLCASCAPAVTAMWEGPAMARTRCRCALVYRSHPGRHPSTRAGRRPAPARDAVPAGVRGRRSPIVNS